MWNEKELTEDTEKFSISNFDTLQSGNWVSSYQGNEKDLYFLVFQEQKRDLSPGFP